MRVISFISTLAIILAVCFSSCESKPISQDISILLDQSEEHFSHISAEEFTKISILTENENNGESVRIQPITEFGFNPVRSFKMDAVTNVLWGNDFERDSLVIIYFSGIDSVLSALLKERKERTGSVIYKIMSEELNRLSVSKADRKILIINSDLMEKSFIDLYSSETFNQLKTHPDKIQDTLLEHYPLKNLDGIEIYIIYKPMDKNDNERFEIVSGFYRNFFEEYGAQVILGCDLKTEY